MGEQILNIIGAISGIIGIIGFLFNIDKADSRKKWGLLVAVGVIVIVLMQFNGCNNDKVLPEEEENKTEAQLPANDDTENEKREEKDTEEETQAETEHETTGETESLGQNSAREEYDIEIAPILQAETAIEDIAVSTLEGNTAYIENYTGKIETDEQEDIYTFQTQVSGRYRIEISGLLSGVKINLEVYNAAGEYIDRTSSGIENGGGLTLENLAANETYSVHVKQYNSYSEYILTVGHQKSDMSITSATEVTDSIEYTNQRNVYEFIPSVNGTYRFEMAELVSGVKVNMSVYNAGNEKESGTSYGIENGEGITIENMVAGETYKIYVEQYNSYGSYKLLVGHQKEIVGDVAAFTAVQDSIQYTDQRNIYQFIPPIEGRYRFEMSGLISGNQVNMFVYNQAGEQVEGTSYGIENGGGLTVLGMVAGETYQVVIKQYSGYSPYKLKIGKQKAYTEVGSPEKISDSVEYTEQRNVYLFTPLYEGDYRFKVSGLTSGVKVNMRIFNEGEEQVDATSYGVENGFEMKLEKAVAGETYQVQILQYEGMSDYILEIF